MKETKRISLMEINKLDTSAIQIPYYFRCPISLELMSDPVTVLTGQTYDRISIDSWIATGNTSCPVTRTPLSDYTLIPNHTLRRLIQDWCVQNRCFGVERIPTPKQPVEPSFVRSLLNQAGSSSNLVVNRVAALRKVRLLARESVKNRLDIRSVVGSILFDSDLSDDLRYESLAIHTVFPPTDPVCSEIASDSEKIGYLVDLLLHPNSVEVRVNSAALIELVIAGTKSPDLRSTISSSDEIFLGVVDILTRDTPSPRAIKVGVKTLFALSLTKQHRHKAVTAGAADALIRHLPELDKIDCERALATIELLCRTQQGCAALGDNALTVPLLVKTILKFSDRATEYAAGALLSLCSSVAGLRREAVNAGILTKLLVLVQSERTERAKRKAQMLLKLVMESWMDIPVGVCDGGNGSIVVPF